MTGGPEGQSVPLRTWPDRLRQVLLFELIGLVLVTPVFAWVMRRGLADSAALMVVLSLLAATWNAAYGSSVDWAQARLFGRRADQRGLLGRVLHAVFFEGGLLILSLPVIVMWTGLGWWEALVADVGLSLTYAAYAFVFNLAYDRRFPIAEK